MPSIQQALKKMVRLNSLPRIHLKSLTLNDLKQALPPSFPVLPKRIWQMYWQRYFRLCLSFILSQDIPRYIWLDDDIIVEADIQDLWSVSLHGAPLAVANDWLYPLDSKMNTSHPSFPLLGVSGTQHQIQAGIQLVDLSVWRSERLFSKYTEKLFEFMLKHDYWFSDQIFLSLLLSSPHFNISHALLPDRLHVFYLHPDQSQPSKQRLIAACHLNHDCILHWNGLKPYTEKNIFGTDIWNAYSCLASFITGYPLNINPAPSICAGPSYY